MHFLSASASATASVLVLIAATLVTPASALPARSSTSLLSRRAHLARHSSIPSSSSTGHSVQLDGAITGSTINVNFNSRRGDVPHAAGDHSIVIDASNPTGAEAGGINNSTINLTVISRRAKEIISSWLAGRSEETPSAAERKRNASRRAVVLARAAKGLALAQQEEALLAPSPSPSSSSSSSSVVINVKKASEAPIAVASTSVAIPPAAKSSDTTARFVKRIIKSSPLEKRAWEMKQKRDIIPPPRIL